MEKSSFSSSISLSPFLVCNYLLETTTKSFNVLVVVFNKGVGDINNFFRNRGNYEVFKSILCRPVGQRGYCIKLNLIRSLKTQSRTDKQRKKKQNKTYFTNNILFHWRNKEIFYQCLLSSFNGQNKIVYQSKQNILAESLVCLCRCFVNSL